MNNVAIFVIAVAFLFGVAAAQKDDYASCNAAGECKNKCCLNQTYCSPPVEGTCSSQNLEKVCGRLQTVITDRFCSLINQVSQETAALTTAEKTAVLPTVLRVVTLLLDGVVDLLEILLPILDPLLQAVKLLLGGLDGGLDTVLNVLNDALGHLLLKLLG